VFKFPSARSSILFFWLAASGSCSRVRFCSRANLASGPQISRPGFTVPFEVFPVRALLPRQVFWLRFARARAGSRFFAVSTKLDFCTGCEGPAQDFCFPASIAMEICPQVQLPHSTTGSSSKSRDFRQGFLVRSKPWADYRVLQICV
jgi:hypothetical protein